jgi:hypothetical protein
MLKKHFSVLGISLGLVLIILTLLSGCSDITNTVIINTQISINSFGNMTYYYSTFDMPLNTYQQIEKTASSNGYSSVREYYLRDFGGSNQFFEYDEQGTDTKTIVLKNVAVVDRDHLFKSMSLNFINNELTFNDSTFANDYFVPKTSIKKLDYSVTSPAKITYRNSNTISDDGKTAYWTKTNGEPIPTFFIMSNVPVPENTVVPGFEAVAAIAAVCGSVFLVLKRK